MQAAELWRKRKHSQEQCQHLLTAMRKYYTGEPLYDQPCSPGKDNVRLWWASLREVPSAAQLVPLALLLLDIPPQAAGVERTFSHFGWLQSKVMGQARRC